VSKEDRSWSQVGRLTPAQGVHLTSHQPVVVWLTVCTKDRVPWLKQTVVQEKLRAIWRDEATAWLMGDYLLMPDHLHGFCAPNDPKCELEEWIAYWKRQLARKLPQFTGGWQRGGFHHRLRSRAEFREKWLYTMENPVRKKWVQDWRDWPWRGKVHDVKW
jgi:putative transposase